jgi:hypothetical protein
MYKRTIKGLSDLGIQTYLTALEVVVNPKNLVLLLMQLWQILPMF